ncbi:MAG: hypothetical protein AAF456_17790 [Planctomycetota bacterium]
MKTTITCATLAVVLIAFQYGTGQEVPSQRPKPEPRPTTTTVAGQAQSPFAHRYDQRLAEPAVPPAAPAPTGFNQAYGFTATAPNVAQGQQDLFSAPDFPEAGVPLALVSRGRMASRESEMAVAKAVSQLAQAEGEDQRDEAITQIEQALGDQYDEYLEYDQQRLDQMRERLERLEEQFQKRQEAKERMVELKLEMIVSEADGIGWPDGRGGSGYFRRPMGFALPAAAPELPDFPTEPPTAPSMVLPRNSDPLELPGLGTTEPQEAEVEPRVRRGR